MSPFFSKAREFLGTAYGVMAVVIAMYLVKVVAKVGFGTVMHSPMIEGDGWHNASDISQAALVIVGVWLAKRPANREYPFGLRGVDAVWSLLIGLMLLWAAVVNVLAPSLLGVANAVLPADAWARGLLRAAEPSRLDAGGNSLLAFVIMLSSALVSVAVSRYQIGVGTRTGHQSVVADGKETLGDGKIEALAGVGVAAQWLVGWPWIEYGLGVLMAVVMVRTAAEILTDAGDRLLNRSLGVLVDVGIRAAAEATCGVRGVVSVVTYRRGTCAVAEVTVESRLNAAQTARIERHLAACVRERLTELEEGSEPYVIVRVVPAPIEEVRYAYLARVDATGRRIVDDDRIATHVILCQTVGSTRVRDVPLRGDRSLLEMLEDRHVSVLYVRGDVRPLSEALRGKVRVASVPSSDPRLLGIP